MSIGGRPIATDARSVSITEDPDAVGARRARWQVQSPDVPLVVVESPFRALVGPVVAYLDVLDQVWMPNKGSPATIPPEYVARRWWDRSLHDQTSKRLKAAFVGREHTVIADVPYRREQ